VRSTCRRGRSPWRATRSPTSLGPPPRSRRISLTGAPRIRPRPTAICLAFPRATYMPYPFEIAQTPKMIAIPYEFAHALRSIPVDGSPHPDGLPDTWMGDSRAHWEGDSLVVDVRNFNDQTWFDRAGNFHSDGLHVWNATRFATATTSFMKRPSKIPRCFTRPGR